MGYTRSGRGPLHTPGVVFAGMLIVAVLAACTVGASAAPRTPAALPSGATALELKTEPSATSPPSANWACALALFAPVRLVRDGEAVAFVSSDDGTSEDLVWPRGFSARLVDGFAEVVAPDGSLIAREGDVISNLSGSSDHICRIGNVIYPPAS